MGGTIIGVDLGGTQMRAGRFDSEFNLLERVAEPTFAHQGREKVIARLLDVIARVVPDDSSLAGIGVSLPGPINPHDGTVVKPPNLPGWHNVPIRKIIHERFGSVTHIGNDANVAALAEATRGAAQGYKYVLYLTVSTGIGSGIIDNGRLLVGSQGLGAEAGHMIMVVDGEVLDLEQAAAGPAIARQAVARLKRGTKSSIPDLVGGRLDDMTAKIVGEAAASGDALAIEVIERAGYLIGLGIVSLLHVLNPQIVVVGGGVTNTGELLFAPMRKAVKEHVLDPAYYEHVPIVQAALGDNVALIGAAALVTTRGGTYLP
jgi:glucokinase